MELVLAAVVVLGLLAFSKKGKGTASADDALPPPPPPPQQPGPAAGPSASGEAATWVGTITGGVATVAGATVAVLKGAGVIGSSAGTATGGNIAASGATTSGGTGSTVASTATGSGAIAGEVAGETVAVSLSAAEIAADAAFIAVVVAFIVALLILEGYSGAYFPQDIFRTNGARRRMAFTAYATMTDLLVKFAQGAKANIHLGRTYDGLKGDDGRDVSAYKIPTVGGSPQDFIEVFPAEKGAQQILVNLALWSAFTKLEAQNEYLKSFYFVTKYAQIAVAFPRNAAQAIAATEASMEADGVALTPAHFAEWRDSFLSDRNLCPWKVEVTTTQRDQLGRWVPATSMVDTVFDSPPLWWGGCVNEALARVPNARGIADKARVFGHGEAINIARFQSDNTFSLEQQKQTLERIGGYNKRPSSEWPGESDYVDQATGWYFTPRMVLRDENRNVIQTRVT